MKTTEPISPSEFDEIKRFVRRKAGDGAYEFSQDSTLSFQGITLMSEDLIRIDLSSNTSDHKYAIELLSSDFPQCNAESDLVSSDHDVSHRVFEMTVALTEFGHMTDFQVFQNGSTIRVLPYGKYRVSNGLM